MHVDYQKLKFTRDERFPDRPQEECDHQQRRVFEHDERAGLDCVQAFVCNVSFPSTLASLDYFAEYPLVESLLDCTETEWTVPKWAKAGDIILFMHAKTARTTITRLRTELLVNKDAYSKEKYQRLMHAIRAGLEIHAIYGGKIFAIGRVRTGAEYLETDDDYIDMLYWDSRTYAEIDHVVQLRVPIDISEFNSFITISRGGSITPVWGHDFDRLKELMAEKNQLPWYVTDSSSRPLPLRKINRDNWIQVANDYRRCFILEDQFRKFYVDYLLHAIGDQKTFYTECACHKPGINTSYMDYVMLFKGKYLPVETKLSVAACSHITKQVNKYCFNTSVYLNDRKQRYISGSDFHPGKVLVVDTEKIYMYDALIDTLVPIYELDDLTDFSKLADIKEVICDNL